MLLQQASENSILQEKNILVLGQAAG